ncbi:MAG: sodium-dependent bicarbonate transport family permease [Planctomycetia bacterium]|nr:sodium-dependent bicarbonate transport family permease [Planctomycetia bacterium]
MDTLATLQANLLSPITLAFALGIVARLAQSEISLPKDLYTSLSIYLLFALGIKGGVELTHASAADIFWPVCATLVLGCLTPVTTYLGMRHAGGFSVADSAAVAAHYGSVSAVTFIAAQQFCLQANLPLEGYLPTLLTLMESPGIHIALAMGAIGTLITPVPAVVAVGSGTAAFGYGNATVFAPDAIRQLRSVLHEILTGRTMVLLVGGMLVGYLMGDVGYKQVQPFFEGGFKGALTLFILEMGLTAGARLGDLRKVGPFLVAFGILVPIVHGMLGVVLGHWAGLSVGGCTVLAAMAASASYIAAPPAVRMTLPEANPTYYLTLALAITFPFNLVLGIPLYERFATYVAGL